MEIQARIPPALCAVHNFIHHNDPSDFDDTSDPNDIPGSHATGGGIGDLAIRAINAAERERAQSNRDKIATEMWNSYMASVQAGGIDLEG